MTLTGWQATCWAIAKFVVVVLWTIVRICLIIIIAFGLGTIRGLMRSKPPSQHG